MKHRRYMKYVFLFILNLYFFLLLFNKEGFQNCKKDTNYPNAYLEDARKVNRRYVKNRDAIVDYYNSRSYDFSPQYSENENVTITFDQDVQRDKTYKILDKMDTLLTKMIKDEEINKHKKNN